VDPVYATQTTIAVSILHKIHYGIEVLKKNKKTDYWLLENPVEATTIEQNFVLLLVENVVWKKMLFNDDFFYK
jgi:hypothetical protein